MSHAATSSAFQGGPSDRRLPVSWGVVASVGIHVVMVAVFVALSMFEPPRMEITTKPISAKLVRLGAKRDEKLLPRKETPAPPPPAKTVEIPSPNAPPSVKPKVQDVATRIDKPSPEKQRSKVFDAFNKTAVKHEEKAGDPSGDAEGDSDTAEEGERYFGLILAKARRNYGITKTISPAELVRLKAVVILYIGPTGELVKDPELQTSSGNSQFDNDVLSSLKKAAPFGPPPAHLAKSLKTVGVAVECKP